MKPFVPALFLFVAIVGVAPAIGHVRDFIFKAFPAGSVRFLAVAFALLGAALLVFAVARIRDRRRTRYGLLLGVLALLWVQTVGLATGQVKVDVVEKFHILEYGALAFLLYWASLRRTSGRGSLTLFVLVLFTVTVAGTVDEGVQWLVPQRTGDIRDVALNATAGLSGLLFGAALLPPKKWSWWPRPTHQHLLWRGAAITVLALGLFFCVAHLGHEIEDPEIGRFRSRYTAEQLHQLSADRKQTWSVNAPTELATWAIEDRFLAEAAWHAGHRESSFRAGHATLAWLANRVLEKYYDPFLDIESFRGSGRHRYPAWKKQQIENEKQPHDPRTYFSPVAQGRIFPGSKPLFLTGLGLVVAGLWLLPRISSAVRARRSGRHPGVDPGQTRSSFDRSSG